MNYQKTNFYKRWIVFLALVFSASHTVFAFNFEKTLKDCDKKSKTVEDMLIHDVHKENVSFSHRDRDPLFSAIDEYNSIAGIFFNRDDIQKLRYHMFLNEKLSLHNRHIVCSSLLSAAYLCTQYYSINLEVSSISDIVLLSAKGLACSSVFYINYKHDANHSFLPLSA